MTMLRTILPLRKLPSYHPLVHFVIYGIARYIYKFLGNDKGKKDENEMRGNSLSTPSPLAGE